jgi:hypothetical protein
LTFLNEWQKLLGANPANLSLAQQTGRLPARTWRLHEQRAFNYPLRGVLAESRYVSLTTGECSLSSTIPDAVKFEAALVGRSRLRSEGVATRLAGRQISH